VSSAPSSLVAAVAPHTSPADDAPGPGDHTMGYRGKQPHFKSTYWDLGRSSALDPPLQHRPPSAFGTPHKHHFLSMPVYPPRVFQGDRNLLPDDQELHDSFRPPVPAPTRTLRVKAGSFGAGTTIVKPTSAHNLFKIVVGEDSGQPLAPTPPIRQEGDMTLGFRGTEPHFSSSMSKFGRGSSNTDDWGSPNKHHFSSMPCFPDVVHKKAVPNKPKKQEGDLTRGYEGPRPQMWSTYWELGNDTNYRHTRKRYDASAITEKNYRFAVAREGFAGSSV